MKNVFDFANFASSSVFDKASTIAFYVTLGLILFVGIVYILVKKNKPEEMASLNKSLIGVIVGYAIGLISILLFLKLDGYIAKGYVDKATFIPVLTMLISVIVLAIAGFVISVFKPSFFKKYSKIALSIIAIFLAVIIVVTLIKNYQGNQVEAKSEVSLYVFTALIVAAIATIALLFGKKYEGNDTKAISYAAICIAMSFALSYLRFFELPQGGSITFASLLPLMIFSYMFGIRKGVLVGIIYGFLQFIQAPWFYHPIQFLLDYPIAFSAIGLTGLLKEVKVFDKNKVLQFALGAIIAVIIRYFAHVISGIFVFGSGDPANYNAVAWSFLYNAFTFADLAIALFVGCFMFASKSFIRLLNADK